MKRRALLIISGVSESSSKSKQMQTLNMDVCPMHDGPFAAFGLRTVAQLLLCNVYCCIQ